jgi:hypothetical protein
MAAIIVFKIGVFRKVKLKFSLIKNARKLKQKRHFKIALS